MQSVSPKRGEQTSPVAPYLHAYVLKNPTNQVEWKSQTENIAFVLFARVVDSIALELSFLVVGAPIWFSALESFCAQFTGASLNEVSCLTVEKLIQIAALNAKQAHVAHALFASIMQLVNQNRGSA